ncbi:hypothetical protein BJY52DRAFT_1229780 [Lactarius psammicola]|nr:hypothetical protein BJY52DRAFT_1229780 [Lactarius psammicola]
MIEDWRNCAHLWELICGVDSWRCWHIQEQRQAASSYYATLFIARTVVPINALPQLPFRPPAIAPFVTVKYIPTTAVQDGTKLRAGFRSGAVIQNSDQGQGHAKVLDHARNHLTAKFAIVQSFPQSHEPPERRGVDLDRIIRASQTCCACWSWDICAMIGRDGGKGANAACSYHRFCATVQIISFTHLMLVPHVAKPYFDGTENTVKPAGKTPNSPPYDRACVSRS